MDTSQIIGLLMGFVAALVAIVYGALIWEIRKLREAKHTHANLLTALLSVVTQICRKVGIDWEYRGKL
jgi:hypothetical protein